MTNMTEDSPFWAFPHFRPELFDKTPEEIGRDVLAELVEDEPVSNVAFGHDSLDRLSDLGVVCGAGCAGQQSKPEVVKEYCA